MKTKLIFICFLFGQLLTAQTFTEVFETPFEDVHISSIAFADVDGDNDQDVLITGRNNSQELVAELYLNDGLGNYNDVIDTPFEGVFFSSIVFADVDGDNDQDILITGEKGNLDYITKLYINDGTGAFHEMLGTSFEEIHDGSVAFADVDGDNDQDVLIVGVNNSLSSITKLYTNDGLGNFSEVMGTPFVGVEFSSIAFADVDNDNDQDVLIIGFIDTIPTSVANLYINDGVGNFTLMTGTPFVGTVSGSVAFADVDGDSDQDVIITGQTFANDLIAKLYLNNGLGDFSEVSGTPFEGVHASSISFADVDGDNDQDLLITGKNAFTLPPSKISKLYTNDGQGIFSEVIGTPFEAIYFGSIAFADVDNDNDQDVLITGRFSGMPDTASTRFYINEIFSSLENVRELDFEFKLFPNPTGVDEINLSYISKNNSAVDIKISDLNGRVLKQLNEPIGIGEQNISIDISKLSKGSYFIELNDGVGKSVQQFLVQ